jgi:hypothetical protein
MTSGGYQELLIRKYIYEQIPKSVGNNYPDSPAKTVQRIDVKVDKDQG